MACFPGVFAPRALAFAVALCAACGGDGGASTVTVGEEPDAGDMDMEGPDPGCDMVQVNGDFVVEHETNFTARFAVGEPYTKTVMLFGGEAIEDDNVLSNAYVMGLDKEDALQLAEDYPDFYLCSSPGGQAAASMVRTYDLVPASCEVYEKLVTALRVFARNRASGGDRTSIRFEGAPLELESVVDDASGVDVTDQIHDQEFHLVTSVEQLTGESVLEFGTSP